MKGNTMGTTGFYLETLRVDAATKIELIRIAAERGEITAIEAVDALAAAFDERVRDLESALEDAQS